MMGSSLANGNLKEVILRLLTTFQYALLVLAWNVVALGIFVICSLSEFLCLTYHGVWDTLSYVVKLYLIFIQIVLHWTSTNDERMKSKINDHEVTDILKAMLVPVGPYGCVFSYSGGLKNLLREIIIFFFSKQNWWTYEPIKQIWIWWQHLLCHLWQNDSWSKTNCKRKVQSHHTTVHWYNDVVCARIRPSRLHRHSHS